MHHSKTNHMNTRYYILFALFFVLGAQAQNVFLDRAYWKAAPTVTTVKADIKKGNNPAELNSNAFDATVYAIIENAPDATVKFLLDQPGNDVNKITHDGRTYIFWAAYKGNTELMQYLQKRGAKTDIIEDHGYTIANFAASTGQANTKVYELCVDYGAKLQKDLDHEGANALLLSAANAKDLSLIDYFLNKGVDLKSTDAHGSGLLDYAAKAGSQKVMEALLAKGLHFSDNAMIMAAQGTRANTNTLETYKFLESKGANTKAVSASGDNPLHFIVRKEKQSEIVQYFLSKEVDVNQANKDGNTVFMNAARSSDLAVVDLLAGKTKNVNALNAKGQSALALAVQNNSVEVVSFLLEKGADVNVSDKDGNGLTYYLAQSYNAKKSEEFEAKVQKLEAKGFSLAEPQKNGNTLYHFAVAKDDLDLAARAQSLKIDINQKNKEGLTALHKAAMTAKNDKFMKFLIESGAQTSAKTDMDETAFELAGENELLKKNNVSIDFLKA